MCLKPSLSPFLTHVRYSSGKKKGSVARYIRQQLSDEYAVKAREHSYRARSSFKLMEIDDKFKFLRPGKVVVDVGCAPGSWSQVVVERCELDTPSTSDSTSEKGYLLGIDKQILLPLRLRGAEFLSECDITSPATHREISKRLGGRTVDVLLSDMAPNPTGDAHMDHSRLLSLCMTVLSITEGPEAPIRLSPCALFLCKIWDGTSTNSFIEHLKLRFKTVQRVKPRACRDHSAELYILATKLRSNQSR